jgi:hypothetical protein
MQVKIQYLTGGQMNDKKEGGYYHDGSYIASPDARYPKAMTVLPKTGNKNYQGWPVQEASVHEACERKDTESLPCPFCGHQPVIEERLADGNHIACWKFKCVNKSLMPSQPLLTTEVLR